MTQSLVQIIQKLSLAQTLADVIEITRKAARKLTGADGATFILRDGHLCHYIDEDAIAPLWKGMKFPLQTCISGWTILNQKEAVIEDIYTDPRVPVDAYRPTFVKSLVMVPIREKHPIGAIGNYWASSHKATEEELELLKALANSTAIAIKNVQLMAALKKANSELEHSIQLRDEFLSIASHELRTPIATLKLQLQITERRLKSELAEVSPAVRDTQDCFKISLRQISNLHRMVDQLLDLSRIRLDRVELCYSRFDFTELVSEILDQHMSELIAVGCAVERDFSAPIIGDWDRMRLEQVIGNLLTNVVKYAPGLPVQISVTEDEEKKSVQLSVKDHGPGIAKEDQDRIFERFERANLAPNTGGMGLGLYIAHQLVKSHNGKITLKSEKGNGAQFIVDLPVRPALSCAGGMTT